MSTDEHEAALREHEAREDAAARRAEAAELRVREAWRANAEDRALDVVRDAVLDDTLAGLLATRFERAPGWEREILLTVDLMLETAVRYQVAKELES